MLSGLFWIGFALSTGITFSGPFGFLRPDWRPSDHCGSGSRQQSLKPGLASRIARDAGISW